MQKKNSSRDITVDRIDKTCSKWMWKNIYVGGLLNAWF